LELPKERVTKGEYFCFFFLERMARFGSNLGRRQGLDCVVVHKTLKNVPKLSKGIQVRGAITC